jgi:ADP-ribose pyrophosphatase YjhB (NUDIX family)
MKFCSECGARVVYTVPLGDSKPRFFCEPCNRVHYQNPRVIVGCIAHWQGKVLLCKRAIDPRIDTWTVPAGFMENGESMESGALREAREETGANIHLDDLYSVFDIERINQVYIIYRGVMLSPDVTPGPECSQVQLFAPDDIPWDSLFYPAIKDLLTRFETDLASGRFSLYTGTSVAGRISRIEPNDR